MRTVSNATCAVQLMEAALVLEFYISRKWISDQGWRLISNGLPSAHAAIRGCSLPAVALRVFCLDRELNYEKVVDPPRSSRSSDKIPPLGLAVAKPSRPAPKVRGEDRINKDRSSVGSRGRARETEGASDQSDAEEVKPKKKRGRPSYKDKADADSSAQFDNDMQAAMQASMADTSMERTKSGRTARKTYAEVDEFDKE